MTLLTNHGELSGADLVKHANGELKRGTVYSTLIRMSDKGYVESREGETPKWGGPPRRYYTLSGYGAKVYQAHAQLRELVGLEPAFGGAG